MTIDVLPDDVEDYLTHLAIEKGRAANTLTAYRRDLGRYVGFLGTTPVTSASPEHVRDFSRTLQADGLARTSVNRTITAVRGMHRYLFAEGVTTSDPTADLEPARLPKGLPKAISENDVVRLIDAVDGTDALSIRDRAILEVLYGTGMRISECVGLSLDDLDLDAALIRVTGKGDKQRLVPVGRLAEAALTHWLSPSGRLGLVPDSWATRDAQMAMFLNHRGGRLSRQGMWGIIRKYGQHVGLAERLSPHVLRHSCATHMLDHGADIRTVQELLGHASISTTQLYTKVSTDLMVRAYTAAHPRATGRPGAQS